MSRLDDLNHEQLEGVHELVQAWDAAKRRYFEEHLPACKCVSCRAEPDEPLVRDPFDEWIDDPRHLTYWEWLNAPRNLDHVSRPPSSVDVIRSLPMFPTFARWWIFLGDVAHLGYRAACAIIWGVGWMIRGPLISIVSAGRFLVLFCVPRFLWPRVMPSKRLRSIHRAMTPCMCAYCGHNVAATVTGCPDHGGINPRPRGPPARPFMAPSPHMKPPPPPAPPAKRDTGVILRS